MSRERSHKVFFILVLALVPTIVAGSIGVAEFQLRRLGSVANYCERTDTPCPMFRDFPLHEPWLLIRPVNTRFAMKTAEFEMALVGNSIGLPGADIPAEKQTGEYRIVVLGDSFTEGVGATPGHGYVDLLRKRFEGEAGYRRYTVINAGISGSDPVFYLELLKRRLLAYKPDLVLMTLNFSDIDDIMKRGGKERFGKNGELVQGRATFGSWLFEHSHLARAFFLNVLHYDWNLRAPAESKARLKMAVRTLIESGRELSDLAKSSGFDYAVLIHPYPYEVSAQPMPPALAEIELGMRGSGVSTINLFEGMRRKIPQGDLHQYYWPKDLHYNDKGYKVFADVLWDELKQSHSLSNLGKL